MAHVQQLYEVYPEGTGSTVPYGLRVDGYVVAGRITGCDPENREPAGGLEEQTKAAFEKIAILLEQAGGGLENLGRATAFVTRREDREPVNGEWWYQIFPDPQDRPAYKVILADLPFGHLVHFDIFGVLGERRKRFDLPGVPARDPTVRIGDMIFSSRCHGIDGATGEIVKGGIVPEAALTFKTLRELASAAGGSPDDIVQVNAFGKTEDYVAPTRAAFEEAFLDLKRKPVLNTFVNFIEPRFEISADMIAVIRGGR